MNSLKYGGVQLRKALVELFNAVIAAEETPRQWRENIVTFIPKKGPSDKIDNYRGIAVASNIGKLYTKIVCDRMNKIIEENNILGEIQNGFRKLLITCSHLHKL